MLDLREVWKYRELLWILTMRDVTVRYKQTVVGAAWAILQPLATMIVFSVFFGRLVNLTEETGVIPYPIFVFAGLLPVYAAVASRVVDTDGRTAEEVAGEVRAWVEEQESTA